MEIQVSHLWQDWLSWAQAVEDQLMVQQQSTAPWGAEGHTRLLWHSKFLCWALEPVPMEAVWLNSESKEEKWK